MATFLVRGLPHRSVGLSRHHSSRPFNPTTFSVRRVIPLIPPDKFFATVANVDDYHKFLPYCSGSQVTKIVGIVGDIKRGGEGGGGEIESGIVSESESNNRSEGKFVFEADLDIGVEGTPFKEIYKSR